MAQLHIPDEVYNWLVSFFHGHTHSTQYMGVESSVLGITASIIQGSAIGPASFVVGAADLNAVTPGNLLVKFADDTYIVIRVANRPGRAGIVPELTHGVPCPGRGSFCPGNVKINHRAWMAVQECVVFCIVFVSRCQSHTT